MDKVIYCCWWQLSNDESQRSDDFWRFACGNIYFMQTINYVRNLHPLQCTGGQMQPINHHYMHQVCARCGTCETFTFVHCGTWETFTFVHCVTCETFPFVHCVMYETFTFVHCGTYGTFTFGHCGTCETFTFVHCVTCETFTFVHYVTYDAV